MRARTETGQGSGEDSLTREEDERLMTEAVEAARRAAALGEVPVGAVVVAEDGRVLAVAGNRTRTDCDPTAHAEVVALREAARAVGNFRLVGATMYATVEPCAMCAGALVQARVRRLVYGARDERAGAVESVFRVCDASFLNHQMELTAGVLEAECRGLMQAFFRARRTKSGEVA
ncbi:MAG TPA: tRNA adenosine(34) deaminase TadA [Pyrinomonadaceae bacterium]|nr:tRNA adenosine(34) deaminase TadA [Pyrinomonadaceae bacterium]